MEFEQRGNDMSGRDIQAIGDIQASGEKCYPQAFQPGQLDLIERIPARDEQIATRRTIHLVTLLTCKQTPLFNETLLTGIMARSLRHQPVAVTLAYVIFGSRVHWLFCLPGHARLSAVITDVKISTARTINALYGRTQTIWKPGWQSFPLHQPNTLQQIGDYMTRNADARGLAAAIRDYAPLTRLNGL